jgi:dCMP deaminase
MAIDWDVINTGCPNCKAKAGGPKGLQYHGLSWWCLRCGAGANWEEDKSMQSRSRSKPKEETTTDHDFNRLDWNEYFKRIAEAVSLRGDCKRRQIGAIIVKHRRIVATGYNGTPPGGLSCLNGDCPRADSDLSHNHPDYSSCIALHAEQNAIAYANRADTDGATIYITSEPCDMCVKLIKAAGIVRVVTT